MLMRSVPDEMEAADLVRQRLRARVGYEDLSNFHVIGFTEEEIQEIGDDSDWVGQYVAGSADSERGITVLVRPEKHDELGDLVDTIGHELGHAIWELLDNGSRRRWPSDQEDFADHFMFYLRGTEQDMEHRKLFLELSAAEQK